MNRPVFDIFGSGDCWHWHLVATNGQVIAASSRLYTRKRDCERAIDAVFLAIFDAGQEFHNYDKRPRDPAGRQFRSAYAEGKREEALAASGDL